MRTRLQAVLASTCLALAPFSQAVAQSYPSKPIHIIVAFAPGGPVDVVARLAADKLPEILGQPVVVENRPSSTGNLGTQVVAKAAPDGYTILATSSAFAVNVSLLKDPGYEVKEFVPIVQAATQPNLIVVNSTFPAKTLPETQAYLDLADALDRHARTLRPQLERLLTEATPAGRVYAADLLYKLDPVAGRDAAWWATS